MSCHCPRDGGKYASAFNGDFTRSQCIVKSSKLRWGNIAENLSDLQYHYLSSLLASADILLSRFPDREPTLARQNNISPQDKHVSIILHAKTRPHK